MENLLKLQFIASLDYDHMLKAHALVNRDIPKGALYFWYNLVAGHYRMLPSVVLQKDLATYCAAFPEFAKDFEGAL